MGPGRSDLLQLRVRAEAAEARADAAAQRAECAAVRAQNCPPGLVELHLRAADIHRHNEARHRAVVVLYCGLIRQQQRVEDLPEVPRTRPESRAPSAAVILMARSGDQAAFLATDRVADDAQDLEFVHGEGPMRLAWESGHEVRAAGAGIEKQWPQCGPLLVGLGIGSVSAAPMQLQSTIIGVLGVFGTSALFEPAVVSDIASGMATVVADNYLGRPPGTFLIDGMSHIHQAVGMVAGDARCSTSEATLLLRARAYADGVAAAAIAERVLAGDLHLSA